MGQWERALSLLVAMRRAEIAPNVISFNTAIKACEKAGEWERALALLGEMASVDVAPDRISFNTAIVRSEAHRRERLCPVSACPV